MVSQVSEKSLEDAIEAALTAGRLEPDEVGARPIAVYGFAEPGRYTSAMR